MEIPTSRGYIQTQRHAILFLFSLFPLSCAHPLLPPCYYQESKRRERERERMKKMDSQRSWKQKSFPERKSGNYFWSLERKKLKLKKKFHSQSLDSTFEDFFSHEGFLFIFFLLEKSYTKLPQINVYIKHNKKI